MQVGYIVSAKPFRALNIMNRTLRSILNLTGSQQHINQVKSICKAHVNTRNVDQSAVQKLNYSNKLI